MIRKVLTLSLFFAAASAHFPIAHRLRQLDTNNDRALSLAEVLTARQARFVALDSDRNQVLTLAEISRKVEERHGTARRAEGKGSHSTQDLLNRISKRFARLDQNHDEQITQAEWESKVVELFARFDVNNDRLITRPEVRSVWQSKRAQR